ncbi:MAG: REP-associated tyrosine transposase [Acidobacteriaceae bacterium]|nr:REP-associated tyrosine transposase [Acidobacteriaceae bacterium]
MAGRGISPRFYRTPTNAHQPRPLPQKHIAAKHPTVIPSAASRRFFFLLRSREGVGLRSRGISPRFFRTPVHLLIGEPQRGNPSKVLQVVKQKVSRSLLERKTSSGSQTELTFASSGVAAPAFWQRRFYDFNVWSEKKLKEKLHYMHRNPVDRKLVQHPQNWPWSSWSFYAKGEQRLIRIDDLTPRARVAQ